MGFMNFETIKGNMHFNNVCSKSPQSIGVMQRVINIVTDIVLHGLLYALL